MCTHRAGGCGECRITASNSVVAIKDQEEAGRGGGGGVHQTKPHRRTWRHAVWTCLGAQYPAPLDHFLSDFMIYLRSFCLEWTYIVRPTQSLASFETQKVIAGRHSLFTRPQQPPSVSWISLIMFWRCKKVFWLPFYIHKLKLVGKVNISQCGLRGDEKARTAQKTQQIKRR